MSVRRVVLVLVLLCMPMGIFGQTLVGSKKSDKYHLQKCKSAQSLSAENKIEFRSAQEAVAAGYVPCKICKPPVPKSRVIQGTASPKKGDTYTKSAEENRCQAITQKGTQCTRKAVQGSLYCTQHKKLSSDKRSQ